MNTACFLLQSLAVPAHSHLHAWSCVLEALATHAAKEMWRNLCGPGDVVSCVNFVLHSSRDRRRRAILQSLSRPYSSGVLCCCEVISHHQAWCRGQCVARLNLASQDPDGLRHWDALQPKGINCCYRGLNHDLYWRVPYNNLRKRDRKTLL